MRPIGGRSAWLAALLVAVLVLAVASIAVTLEQIDLFERLARGEPVTPDEASASDARVTLVAVLYLAGLAVTGIVWCTWQYRAQKNLEIASIEGLRYTPGWAVGWWFVPFMNLWKPFDAVSELWKGSDPDADRTRWRSVRAWPVLGIWWVALLTAGVIDRVQRASWEGADTLEEMIDADRWSIAGDVILIVAGALAIVVVRSIAARQDRLVGIILNPPHALGGLPADPSMPPADPSTALPVPPPGDARVAGTTARRRLMVALIGGAVVLLVAVGITAVSGGERDVDRSAPAPSGASGPSASDVEAFNTLGGHIRSWNAAARSFFTAYADPSVSAGEWVRTTGEHVDTMWDAQQGMEATILSIGHDELRNTLEPIARILGDETTACTDLRTAVVELDVRGERQALRQLRDANVEHREIARELMEQLRPFFDEDELRDLLAGGG